MTPQSNSQHPSHGSTVNSTSARGTAGGARMAGGDVYASRGAVPASSIPVSDTAISQADGAA